MIQRDEARVLSRSRAYLTLGVTSALAMGLVALLGRDPTPMPGALAALAADAVLLIVLTLLERPGNETVRVQWLRGVLLFAVGVLVAPLGWFFGPNSGFAAAVVLMLLLTGVLSRASRSWTSWLVYATLAGGQAVLVALIVGGVLPDRSLTPLLLPGQPILHHTIAAVGGQLIYLVAFLAGLAIRARYAELARTLETSRRDAAYREVLLEEARADYRRALRVARRGTLTREGPIARRSEPPPPFPREHGEPSGRYDLDRALAETHADARVERAVNGPMRPRREDITNPARAIGLDAYRIRMRGQHAAVIGLCLFGFGIIALLGRHPRPTLFAFVCMAGILAVIGVHRWLVSRRGDESVYWPWAIVGALSVGPSYSFGLHSAFAGVITALLFIGGSFRSAPGLASRSSRLPVLFATMASHALVFGLIMAGVVPDEGNIPVRSPSHPYEPWVLHLLVQGIFAAAFAGGWLIDVRSHALAREAARAAAEAAERDAMLEAAGAEIDRVLAKAGDGLFTGDVVGDWKVGRLVASGGMGDVYEAEHVKTTERAALKLIRRDRASDPLALELLSKEARALVRVTSPHVAHMLDASVEGDLPYVAMELIVGEPLSHMLREKGRLTLDETRALVRDVARGLRDIHEAGVIHRDIKPHNLMLTEADGAPRWKIVDLGIAQLDGVGRRAMGGTPAYMAPEQALGERIDQRADLYGLSAVVYRALTGRPAFSGGDRIEVAHAARERGPEDPTGFVSMSRALELCLRIGLAPTASDRFATARELATAFEDAFEGAIKDRHRARGEAVLARLPWAPPTENVAEPPQA